MPKKTYFEFVRTSDKLLKEWDGERRESFVSGHISALADMDPPKMLQPLLDELPGNIETFRAHYLKFREKYKDKIDLAQARNLLEMCEPHIRSYVKSRTVTLGFTTGAKPKPITKSMDPDTPGNLAYSIRQFIDERHEQVDDVRNYRKLIGLYEKGWQSMADGGNPTKTRAAIEEGRKILGFE